jgi:propanol-preferring alcohol dehydrogenase
MKAWQFSLKDSRFGEADVPDPSPGPGQVVIRVEAAGLCHSDITEMEDANQQFLIAHDPVTIGHEIAGVILELGDGVTGWKEGDRVGICPTASMQLAGPDPEAPEPGIPGYTKHGGFAEKYLAEVGELVRIPDGLDITLGAVATDAGMTAYHAMAVRGAVAPGMKVGVIGYGGLGQIGARVAVLKGAEVHLAEKKTAVWDLAREAGVIDVVADAGEWACQGFDLIVDYAGFGTTTVGAFKAVRFGGTVVQVGLGRTEIEITTTDVVVNQINYLGSIGGSKADIADLYELMRTGDLAPAVTSIPFGDIGKGLDQLRAGEVTGRLAAVPDA